MLMTNSPSESNQRLSALRKLLALGKSSTQDELVNSLRQQKFEATQSTISRDLRRLGAIKATDTSGRTVYRLPEDAAIQSPIVVGAGGLSTLITNIEHNGVMIIIHTSVGSASLIARHLDQTKPGGILGTIAGDDTIFVAPKTVKKIGDTLKAIVQALG